LPFIGKSFGFILFANKMKLLFFGTAKKYLMIEKNISKKENLLYIDFKCIVWHKSFEKNFENIKKHFQR